jgi:hypothetical protein
MIRKTLCLVALLALALATPVWAAQTMHAYDPATGAIVQVFNGKNQGEVQRLEAKGYIVVEGPKVDRNEYTYVDGKLTKKSSADLLAEAKVAKEADLLKVINRFIAEKPDSQPRYDTNLMLNLLKVNMQAMAAGQASPAAAQAADSWIEAVQAKYFALLTAIKSAATMHDLEAVDISYATLEAEYGVSGSVLADPDIHTADLFSQ